MTEQLLLNGRYQLDELLATGGMGQVWSATDQLLARSVAVKLLRPEYVSDEAARSRFQAEARFAASLHHSGIAQVYDYGQQDDLIFLVMELVPGEPLSKIIARTGGLDPEATLDLIAQVARALQVAHSAGIIHRDVKPGNLMVTADSTIKVTDFGIARAAAVSTLTQTGMVMGTAHYVSPEQASGQAITPSTDLYSLGVVAFECLTGRPPFDADTPVAIALQHVRDFPPALPIDIAAPVRELVRQLLAKKPADRPASAQEVADQAYLIRESLALGFDLDEFDDATRSDNLAVESDESDVAEDPDLLATGRITGGPATTAQATTRAATDDLAIDEAATDEATVGTGPRSPLLLAAVAMGVLLLGVILITSPWAGRQGAGLNGNDSDVPASHGPVLQGDLTDPNPVGSTPSPEETPSLDNGGTTVPTPSASPTATASPTPSKTQTITPKPTPPKPDPSTEPSIPEPDPSSSAGSALGS
ncbi:serine/threonine-protein kinase [Actinomadura sp. HBU206391]|uniref:serine/threonine-protein kinase n=1 Tax=Actinomadura sp. HBU206391 TaxID=2731692 RepID=UPI00164F3A46|nr:serine/threonine-protein kinase [Actinomadura sp. HBU206391]MBC6457167.1 protein kinase [Actinomadura sp. HBU206391]